MKEHKAAIYHFTDGGNIRPIVYQKELDRIKQFAADIGYSDAEVYLDKSLKKKEQVQLQNLLQDISNYNALIMKDFYHLRKNTGAFMDDLITLSNRGVNIYTIEDGSFQLSTAPFEQPLRIALYYCGLEIVGRSIELQFEIMNYFVRTCTNWKIIDEKMLIDSGKYYTIIKALKNDEKLHMYSDVELKYGKILLHNKDLVLKGYLEKEYLKFAEIFEKMKANKSDNMQEVENIIYLNREAYRIYD